MHARRLGIGSWNACTRTPWSDESLAGSKQRGGHRRYHLDPYIVVPQRFLNAAFIVHPSYPRSGTPRECVTSSQNAAKRRGMRLLSSNFTQCARLAAWERWGHVGSSLPVISRCTFVQCCLSSERRICRSRTGTQGPRFASSSLEPYCWIL